MNSDAVSVTENLRLGIEAARSGKNDRARTYLTTVLKQEPNNIPALFWSAFVAPSPQESLSLLERVLALDPNNERAQAGISWARKRLEAEAAATAPELASETEPESDASSQPGETKPTPAQTTEQPPEMPDEFIRQELLAKKDVQQRAKKGALAHRARRTIDPLLVIIFILAAAIVLTAGIWLVAVTPAETLAAWLPVATESASPAGSETSAVEFVPATVSAPSDTQAEKSPAQNFTSAGDVIIFKTPLPVQADAAIPNVSTPVVGVPPAAGEPLPRQSALISAEPGEFVGPAQPDSDLNSTPEEATELSQPVAETTTSAPETGEATDPQSGEDPSEENSAVNGSLNEFVESADEVFNGVKLFEPVDESLLAHKPAHTAEKWIEVNVTLQQITAWEGNVPVMHFIGSTGLPGTPTVLGEYNVYWKLEKTLMAGADYYLPDVPYTMYFYGGYAIHGTYWHDNFGQPMSHGCVNLRTEEAKQIFEWADPPLPAGQTQVVSTYNNPGTLVVVHD